MTVRPVEAKYLSLRWFCKEIATCLPNRWPSAASFRHMREVDTAKRRSTRVHALVQGRRARTQWYDYYRYEAMPV